MVTALVDRGAQAAAVLDGDGDALTLGAVEHGVGETRLPISHSRARQLSRLPSIGGCGLADFLLLQILDRRAEFGDTRARLRRVIDLSRKSGRPWLP
jgi:hypothetical protein